MSFLDIIVTIWCCVMVLKACAWLFLKFDEVIASPPSRRRR